MPKKKKSPPTTFASFRSVGTRRRWMGRKLRRLPTLVDAVVWQTAGTGTRGKSVVTAKKRKKKKRKKAIAVWLRRGWAPCLVRQWPPVARAQVLPVVDPNGDRWER